jgi:sugar phosphate isomerase/epimerase
VSHPHPTHLILFVLTAAAACSSPSQRSADSAATSGQAGAPHTITLQGDFKGPLGVQLYTFRDAMPKDVPGTLRRVHDLGFREVEMAGTYGMSAADFKKQLDSAGLTATSMHAGYEQFRDSLSTVLADAKTLGVKFVGTAWIPHPDGQPLTPALAREAAANFTKWGRAAKQQGVQFFYHAHGYEFVPDSRGVRPMDILMTQSDADAVKYEMDVFWISRPGMDPVAWLKKYPTRWRLLHLKDMKKGTPTNVNTGAANPDSTEVPVGSGQIDYRGVLKAAQEVGATQFYLEDETANPFATVPRSVAWLEQVKFSAPR